MVDSTVSRHTLDGVDKRLTARERVIRASGDRGKKIMLLD